MKHSYGIVNRVIAIVAGAAALMPASASLAATVTVPALKDAMIFGTSAGVDTGNASGMGPALFAGADGSLNKKRSLIAFDIASAHIPADATVTDATVTLYLAQVAGSGGGSGGGSIPSRTFSLYRLLQDWGEGTSGSPTSPGVGGTGQGYPHVAGDSTWDYAFYNPADLTAGTWNLSGTNLHGGNFAATASGTSTFTSFAPLNGPYTWDSAGLIADVQSWVSGASPNYGWLLRGDNLESTATSFLGFWSKDGAAANSNPAIAPSLTITFTPEPAGILALAAILPALLLRRSRH
jgi:hypothetical protein